ncbi:MAG: DUF1841 family protein, partial [Gammaproteobacteria bacterium]|nr:DUF1841 family protein [Gammaproteobacteria bacterium]
MLLSNDRQQVRTFYYDVWQKQRLQAPLEPMEKIIASIIEQHPEYHGILENKDASLDKDYLPEQGESNPFLHMSLHVALQEQLTTNRPAGVTAIFEKALQKSTDLHQVEHRFIECISEMLWK